MNLFVSLFSSGWSELLEYLSLHVLTCLIPAFFIAGAVGVFVAQGAVLRFFGPDANKGLSYSVASISGAILAVCSCTILPLFSGIYRRGAGLGPAIAFLYSGPAINVLAIVLSARMLGYDIGLARAVGAVAFAAVIGILMATVFKKRESERIKWGNFVYATGDPKNPAVLLAFFAVLVGILVFGASKVWIVAGPLLVLIVIITWVWFTKEEVIEWMKATLTFVKQITPWLLGGVFVVGMLKVVTPSEFIAHWVGGNSLLSNLISSVSGALMYFATLTEVPIVKGLLDKGMGSGPALALLLAGPALSIPNMLVIRSVLGTSRTTVYVLLVVVMATFTGMLFGNLVA